ncbi:mammalian cell entry protein [Mycobacterium sp.]|uniref:mammalian cell entry protein n=1 Tax=Mycobacterium sp. TaxID=1785 RepID=UPI0012791EE8|nr:mammalian cell entry protein [Mycobacterium sp.]KAA8967494.1 MAG: mammalian cell entry protein [Mycobacterium sp.]
MSPRRRIAPGEASLLVEQIPKKYPWSVLPLPRWRLPRQWWKPSRGALFPLGMSVAALIATAAIATCSLILVSHKAHLQAASKEAVVLVSVRSFMTGFTSLDPFHANAYVDRILASATGDFAKQYREHENEILIQVARAEPTKGTALEAGVERWNDDGSATVLVATEITSKSPDGKQVVENTNRWVVTAQQEGSQWKISNLVQVF